jgi:hypothetical protein
VLSAACKPRSIVCARSAGSVSFERCATSAVPPHFGVWRSNDFAGPPLMPLGGIVLQLFAWQDDALRVTLNQLEFGRAQLAVAVYRLAASGGHGFQSQ